MNYNNLNNYGRFSYFVTGVCIATAIVAFIDMQWFVWLVFAALAGLNLAAANTKYKLDHNAKGYRLVKEDEK